MSRYYHAYPPVRKVRRNYSALFNESDKAKMEYNTNMSFRKFVNDRPEMNLSLLDYYHAYKNGGLQLKLSF